VTRRGATIAARASVTRPRRRCCRYWRMVSGPKWSMLLNDPHVTVGKRHRAPGNLPRQVQGHRLRSEPRTFDKDENCTRHYLEGHSRGAGARFPSVHPTTRALHPMTWRCFQNYPARNRAADPSYRGSARVGRREAARRARCKVCTSPRRPGALAVRVAGRVCGSVCGRNRSGRGRRRKG
jgi:hypothetical protein